MAQIYFLIENFMFPINLGAMIDCAFAVIFGPPLFSVIFLFVFYDSISTMPSEP